MPAVQVTFLGMPRSAAVEAQVQRWVERLAHSFDRILRCAIWIELPHRHHRKGNMFHVRVELEVPGSILVVNRDTGVDHAHENVFVAISDAFRAARSQLRAHVSVVRGDVKLHA